MINSDHGSPNSSTAKLIGQSERLWCVCFMCSTSSFPGVQDNTCKSQVKTLSYSQTRKQKRKCTIIHLHETILKRTMLYATNSVRRNRFAPGFHILRKCLMVHIWHLKVNRSKRGIGAGLWLFFSYCSYVAGALAP